MRICNKCKVEKSVEMFYKQARNKDGLQLSCKSCANEYSKVSEKKNYTKYYHIRKKAKQKLRQQMWEYKQQHGCERRSESDPICLELHHTDPTVKDLNPSDAHSITLFLQEAEKCIVLCSNCHKKEHRDISGK